jgi:nitrite reductase/ring-hydroxylating ferredoxin subunit
VQDATRRDLLRYAVGALKGAALFMLSSALLESFSGGESRGSVSMKMRLPPADGRWRTAAEAFLRNEGGGRITAFKRACTHLGCTLTYDEGSGAFACPCHGSRFNNNGEVTRGPARENMRALSVKELPQEEILLYERG